VSSDLQGLNQEKLSGFFTTQITIAYGKKAIVESAVKKEYLISQYRSPDDLIR